MRLILLLLFSSLAFAQPQIGNIMDNNTDTGATLEDLYNESIAKNSSFLVTFGNSSARNISVSSSIEIVGMNLLLDNMTYPMADVVVITARGYDAGGLRAIPADGYLDFYCTYEWLIGGAQYAWRCDFDEDSCAEIVNQSSVDYDMNVTFTFKDVNESVSFSSNIVEVPLSVRDAMRNSSGMDLLNVSIDGDVLFNYQFDDRSGFDCGASTYFNETANISYSLNQSFLVAGENKLFFLRSPILHEQWFRNNKFNVIVLSQSPIYLANTSMNGNQTKSRTLREFNTTADRFGIVSIYSNLTNATDWSESRNISTPLPLESYNHSFSFIYEFNHTYSGIGENNLSLFVADSFLGESDYEVKLLSRMLSYDGNKTQSGEYDPAITRPSAQFNKGELSHLEIGLGFLAVLLLLTFINFWITR